ncbi:LexA family transcriptional regulator [uncultured Shewanella sp.]|uniref:LexA family protein n=1 Tax=uncultured Shewanella sp. TaxID=173975 RepID=UPI002627BC46|nr:translesion error-prone DNA polymerase V autoproteolytic subunit [uncultured Shewanella sp.]
MKVIPIYIAAGINGFESPAAEYLQLSLSLDELLVEHPSATFLGFAKGDSMQGLGIFDNDILIVDRHVNVSQNDVIVANLNGEFVCKQLDMHRRLLLSSHCEYQAVSVNDYDQFSIEGVVTRSIRCHRPSSALACSAGR